MREDIAKLWDVLSKEIYPLPDKDLCRYICVLEDKRFLYHLGFDPIATTRATFLRVIGKPNGGASTIDMQLVRTITDRREKTAIRKIREIVLSILIRMRFGRRKVISCYIAILYSGYNLKGIDAASRRMFGFSAKNCSLIQKSMLASVILLPVPKFQSLDWWSRLLRRARYARRPARGSLYQFLELRAWKKMGM